MAVTAQVVKELRDRTGLPMMECKKALVATDGDIEKAIEELRKAGAKAQLKLAGRSATEGKIASWRSDDGKKGALATLRCESEPVTSNEQFLAFLNALLDLVVEHDPADVEALKALKHGEGTVGDGLQELVGKIRENFTIGAFARFEGDAVVQYVHFDGKKAAMIELSGKPHDADIEVLGKDLCMHIVHNQPSALSRDEVPAEEVAKEREILRAALAADPKNAKKPAEILDKIVEGRLSKFYADHCLLEQPFVKDESKTVAQVAEAGGVKVERFAYLSTAM